MSLYNQDSMLAKDYREEMVRAVERNRISAGRGAGLWGVYSAPPAWVRGGNGVAKRTEKTKAVAEKDRVGFTEKMPRISGGAKMPGV